ncbi:MAG TPA: ferrous iron transport protein B [Polyangiaceae bacterium]
MPTRPVVLLVGNPNVGKTTLFNRVTGQNARIGNYPGVTVERRSGVVTPPRGDAFELVDVPGAYSLAARSPEEQIAIDSILGLGEHPSPRLCVLVIDAGQLGRNLYFALQLLELRVPTILAVNMIDEVTGNPPNLARLSQLLGVPCVATDARRGTGVLELQTTIARALSAPPTSQLVVPYPAALLADAERVAASLGELPGVPARLLENETARCALALWALSCLDAEDELSGIPEALRARCAEVRNDAGERDLDLEIVGSRYAFIDAQLPRLYERVEKHPPKRKASERVDRVLLHPVFGVLAFVAVMLLVFQALFAWSEPAIGAIESVFGFASEQITNLLPEGFFRDLLVEGVIGGVGNVVVFLPQILLLFLFMGLLEDSGYMARVAFLMDRVMKALGLHGRAFVPMLSGFACAVPAILATRTMERQRDRLLTMMVIPLMTCSARLPVYTLIIAALFPAQARVGWVPISAVLMVGMYLFSLLTTLVAAGVLGRTVIRGRRMPLLLELPPYRIPSLPTTLRMMWERSALFLREAGTVILACTIALWVLLSYPKPDTPTVHRDLSAVQGEATGPTAIEQSYAGRVGKAVEPLIAPLGFDWKLGIGLIGSFAAREVFVSTMGLVYGLGNLDDEALPLREKMRREVSLDGKPLYTPLVGLSLMVFFALSCQCMSTLAVVRRETRSYRWPAFLFAYMTVLAYAASLVVYQGGRLLGF